VIPCNCGQLRVSVGVQIVGEQEIADEFSHTVMHGVKMQKALVHGARPLPPTPIAGSLLGSV